MLVDAVYVRAVTSYTFHTVTANHTISVTFKPDLTSVAEVLFGPNGVFGVYPNPSHIGETNVLYRLQAPGEVSVAVYNIGGCVVRRLDEGTFAAGEVRHVIWDGRDDNNNPVAPGLYVMRFVNESGKQTTKRVTIVP